MKAQTQQLPVTEMIRLRSIEAERISSPKYAADIRNVSIKRDGSLEWLMVKAVYDTALKWTDEITFTYYVLLKGDPENLPQGAKPLNIFSGTVTIVNVPQTRQGETAMFLDPYTLARYGEPTHVAVVVNINGQPAAGMAEPSSSAASEWWTREPPNETPLLTRDKTPYAFIEIDKQNTIKP
ncbi:MAG: hypothetical protein ACO3N7_00920 [Kiritimatiellia bacterium]